MEQREDIVHARFLFFLALANKNRQRILKLLMNGKYNVNDIQKKLNLDQSTVSHNLKCLAFCGFVKSVKRGKNRLYFVDNELVRELFRIVDEHISKYANQLLECEVLKR